MFAYKISWILLHFAIVLLLALIVFLAGIETASDNKVVDDPPMCRYIQSYRSAQNLSIGCLHSNWSDPTLSVLGCYQLAVVWMCFDLCYH